MLRVPRLDPRHDATLKISDVFLPEREQTS